MFHKQCRSQIITLQEVVERQTEEIQRLQDRLERQGEAYGARESELLDRLLTLTNPGAAVIAARMRDGGPDRPALKSPAVDRETGELRVPHQRRFNQPMRKPVGLVAGPQKRSPVLSPPDGFGIAHITSSGNAPVTLTTTSGSEPIADIVLKVAKES